MRHLTIQQACQALRRGRQVEQFLGSVEAAPVEAIRWVTVWPHDDAFHVAVHEVQDLGDPDCRDVSEFPPLDDEEYVGEGRPIASAPHPESALELAGERLGADPGRWVNASIVSDEYRDFRGWAST